jgi:mannosyltransferase OCH1-like enzyme
MLIHQVFFPFEPELKELADLPVYAQQVEKTKANCLKFGYEYKMWNREDCDDLVKTHFPDYYQLWLDFEIPVMRVDFIRYCIISKYGGVYVDCDVVLFSKIDRFEKYPFWFGRWANDEKWNPYIAVMGGRADHEFWGLLLAECCASYYEKLAKPIYQKWRGRFVYQTTGHSMVRRTLKNHVRDWKRALEDCLFVEHQKTKKITEYIGTQSAPFHDVNYSYWFKK